VIGQTISHYRILGHLGGGGMGVVYRAEDVKLGREVALKFLPADRSSDPAAEERFRREARAASALSHPNICTIYEIETVDGRDFIAMELLEGETVQQRLAGPGFAIDEVRVLGRQIAEALEAAHVRGILHRDIKPANLYVTPDGRAKVLDFGLAKRITADGEPEVASLSLTGSGALVGTLAYMSPEQARGETLDARSDVFSLGAVLYEMATRFHAFPGETAAVVLDGILNTNPVPPSELRRVPPDLERAIIGALAKDRQRRFRTAEELARALAPGAARRTQRGLLGRLLAFAVRRRPGETPAPSVSTSTGRPDRKMIAVLPFENLGPADDAYFAAGMTEEITSRLAAVRDLGVISRASAVAYDRKGRTLRDIGRDLGVQYVLDGTVRWQRSDGASRVRVTPVLASVADDTQVWSERYDRTLDELFAVQSAIAESVVEALNITLLEPERAALKARRTDNLDAYHAYLKGLEYLDRLSRPEEDLRMAVSLFERAVELDRGFASAYAALSEAHAMLYHMRYDRSPDRLTEARSAADRVVELNPALAEGHLALGNLHFLGHKDHVAALAEFAIAERTIPDDPRLRAAIGYALRLQGRFEEAARSLRRAFQLNPRDPDLAFEIALTYGALRRFEQSERFCDRSIALAPDQTPAFCFKFLNRIAWHGSPRPAAEILARIPRRARRARALHAVLGRDAVPPARAGAGRASRLRSRCCRAAAHVPARSATRGARAALGGT